MSFIEVDKPDTPDQFLLYQNFPNAFNSGTLIKYQVPHAGFVSLEVYDILGRKVATLISGEKSGESYEVEFNGRNFPSGIYLCRLQTGNYSSVKKMVL